MLAALFEKHVMAPEIESCPSQCLTNSSTKALPQAPVSV
jgi:hypothetical protein